MEFIIFEGKSCENFYPLNLLRGTFDIRCGIFSAKERLEFFTKKKTTLFVESSMESYIRDVYPENCINLIPKDDSLCFNSRALISKKFYDTILKIKDKEWIIVDLGTIIAAKLKKKNIPGNLQFFNFDFPKSFRRISLKELNLTSECLVMEYAWDAVKYLDFLLPSDLKLICNNKFLPKKKNPGFINPKNIFLNKNVNIFPNIVLDASEGSIFIDEGTVIEPFSLIKGPVYIGKNCVIKSGAKIYGPDFIGNYSKVAGEISHSIFHQYVNKQHDGFIGHTYACEFINFGADTVTSNLKNNYSKVSVTLGEKRFNTGMQFLGSLVGDHTKFGINTMVNTGTIIGILANIAGSGFPPKFIKSFTWNIYGRDVTKYKIEEALDTAKIVMGRRGLKMSKQYENLIRSMFEKL
jgi:UDP-N-acetylglucosamine diphosphorylase/glucosamine-1-phosphate N-acetyltransferase